MAQAKKQLVDFLVKKAFEPVLRADSAGRSDSEKAKLQRVQEATRTEIERFKDYGSAEEVVINFKRDLSSDAARKVHSELKALDLPTINDFSNEFEKKAADLGVSK
nr:hypothetical protein REQ54_04778 [Rhizobium sp. Q54]